MALGSESEAAGCMGAIDVDDGEYDAAYLVDGTVLQILAPDGRDAPVVLQRTDEHDPDALLGRIRTCQRVNGRSADVSDLFASANDVRQREWERGWPRRPRWLARRLHGSGPERLDPI